MAVVLAVGWLELVVVRVTAHVVVVAAADGVVAARGYELLVVVAAAVLAAAAVLGFAAADGEEPKETSGDGEGGADPDADEEVGVDGGADAILLGTGLDGTDDDGTHGGGETGGDDAQHDGGETDEPRQARDNAGAVGKDAEEKLGAQDGEGDDEGNLGVAGDGGEDVQSLVDLVGQRDVNVGDAADVVDDVATEVLGGPVVLAIGAVAATVLDLAVAPKGDLVLAAKAEVAGGEGSGLMALADVVEDGLEGVLVELEALEVNTEDIEAVVGDAGEGSDHKGDDSTDGEDDG